MYSYRLQINWEFKKKSNNSSIVAILFITTLTHTDTVLKYQAIISLAFQSHVFLSLIILMFLSTLSVDVPASLTSIRVIVPSISLFLVMTLFRCSFPCRISYIPQRTQVCGLF
jgi:hypothetical protein